MARAQAVPHLQEGGLVVRVETGDGWELRCGDCLDAKTGLASLELGADHVITDPPFDEHTHSRGGNVVRHDGGPQIAKLSFGPLESVAAVATPIATICRRWAIVFCADKQIGLWNDALEACGWRRSRTMCWVKPDASPQFSGDRPGHGWEAIIAGHPKAKSRWNAGGMKGVYTHNRMDHDAGHMHPTQKPRTLMEALVRDFTDPGEMICDPFAGSATTGVACIRLGRRFIGWERDPAFFETAVKRLRATRQQGDIFERPRTKPKQEAITGL